MALADESPSCPSSAQLRALWGRGHRGRAIRAALSRWGDRVGGGDDVDWLSEAFRTSGLPAGAFAVQAHVARRSGQAQAWHGLVRSVLQSGDPWWAGALLDEAGGDSRELASLRIPAPLAIGEPSALIHAWLRDHRDEEAVEAAVGWWVRSGRIDEAERLLFRAPSG